MKPSIEIDKLKAIVEALVPLVRAASCCEDAPPGTGGAPPDTRPTPEAYFAEIEAVLNAAPAPALGGGGAQLMPGNTFRVKAIPEGLAAEVLGWLVCDVGTNEAYHMESGERPTVADGRLDYYGDGTSPPTGLDEADSDYTTVSVPSNADVSGLTLDSPNTCESYQLRLENGGVWEVQGWLHREIDASDPDHWEEYFILKDTYSPPSAAVTLRVVRSAHTFTSFRDFVQSVRGTFGTDVDAYTLGRLTLNWP